MRTTIEIMCLVFARLEERRQLLFSRGERWDEYQRRLVSMKEVVCRENGVHLEHFDTLPSDTQLGEESGRLFVSLGSWILEDLNPLEMLILLISDEGMLAIFAGEG